MRSLAVLLLACSACVPLQPSAGVPIAEGGARHARDHAARVVDASSAPLAAVGSPRTSALGSDESDLPRLYPHGTWLPIEAPLLSMELSVFVVVNGRRVTATLDTGAQTTTMSFPVARQLGVFSDETAHGMPVNAIDSHGDVIRGEKLVVAELVVGERTWRNVDVTVIGEAPGLFLVGADLLRDVDLFVAADEGLVGVFEAGAAPRHPDDLVIPLTRGDRQLTVTASADGRTRADFRLLVDTGAWNTSVPARTGINAGLPADLGYAATTVGLAGEQETRGRFVLLPLRLGDRGVPVGRVLAVASTIGRGDGLGLLGNDVFFRFHSIVSFRDAALRLRPLLPRGNVRLRGPGGLPCGASGNTPCVRVALLPTAQPAAHDDIPGTCLQVDVDGAFAGSTVELAVTAEEPGTLSLFNGGAIRAFLSVDKSGAHHCFTLWRSLERLGLGPETPLQLRWVRTEGVRWPCDPLKTRCITFSGPLARTPLR
jgi:predicted aspartyl protease